jgi:hypothetical protein
MFDMVGLNKEQQRALLKRQVARKKEEISRLREEVEKSKPQTGIRGILDFIFCYFRGFSPKERFQRAQTHLDRELRELDRMESILEGQ